MCSEQRVGAKLFQIVTFGNLSRLAVDLGNFGNFRRLYLVDTITLLLHARTGHQLRSRARRS